MKKKTVPTTNGRQGHLFLEKNRIKKYNLENMVPTNLINLYFKIFLGKVERSKLSKEQAYILELNVKKHVKIFILMLMIIPYVYYVISTYYINRIDTVISALFGVLFISGAAWYAISFGAIPIRFMEFAVSITTYLFASLAVSMSAVFIAASIAVPLLSPVLFIVFFALYAASVKFDIVDALKLGIDETIYLNAKADRVYYLRELSKTRKRVKSVN